MHNIKSVYPWYSYVNRIFYPEQKKCTRKELAAAAAALEAATPEARELVRMVYIDRTHTIRGAAETLFLSYSTAWRRIHAVKMDVARRLGLLEE